uniref:hypothetical protein n=1 Tax=Prosthecobacter sp. TaxID=1965333 RepID=UPI003783F9F7
MKQLLLALLLVSFASTAALADSPEAILKDYRKQATQAVERLNQSLEKAGTPLITKLVSSGDTAGAELLTSQMKAKIAGEFVPSPQASAAQLFSLYDDARAKALAPVQKSGIARIDSLLKTAGGAKLETVTELGKVRAEIEAGKAIVSLSNSSKMMPALWNYYSDASMGVVNGQFIWNPEGTVELKGTNNNSTPGRWQATNNPNVFKVFFTLANKTEEECELRVRGKEAE